MKAILVIEDMPNTCYECPIDGNACLFWAWVDDTKRNKSEHCPLKPLPKKKTEEEEKAKDPYNEDLFYDDYIRGYNDCLDELTGDTE